MSLRICSKDLLNEGVLGRWGKEVILLEKTKVFLMMGGIGKDFKIGVEDGGCRCAGDNIGGAVWDVEKGVVFNVFKGRPGELRGWEMWDKRSGCWGSVSVKIGTWEIPSIVVRL